METEMRSTTPDVNAAAATARPATPSVAARLRMALLVGIAVYPLITAIVYLVAPLTEGWLPWQRNFVVTPLMVAAMIFVVIPTIQKRFGRFVATGRWQA
jgi:antibiotic biosynthesis monooxygenase (ABM) superfamily enzyme